MNPPLGQAPARHPCALWGFELLLAVLGLVTPAAGAVRVVDDRGGSIAVTELDGTAWRDHVAWLPQQPFLFAGTVAANVRLGRPGASDDAIRAGLDRLGLDDLPLDRQLGERGAGLSSGQRRRLGLARVLLRSAPILLLDEPTAGLDAASEARILEVIRAEADGGAAVLLVGHRPGTPDSKLRSPPVPMRSSVKARCPSVWQNACAPLPRVFVFDDHLAD